MAVSLAFFLLCASQEGCSCVSLLAVVDFSGLVWGTELLVLIAIFFLFPSVENDIKLHGHTHVYTHTHTHTPFSLPFCCLFPSAKCVAVSPNISSHFLRTPYTTQLSLNNAHVYAVKCDLSLTFVFFSVQACYFLASEKDVKTDVDHSLTRCSRAMYIKC